jgi:hypothetical protein
MNPKCRQCKHYHEMIAVKHSVHAAESSTHCRYCARFEGRPDMFERIGHGEKSEKGGNNQREITYT